MTPALRADHEAAARAAGLRLEWKTGVCKGGPFCAPFLAGTDLPWRPLDDDGDSRRLQVACGLWLAPRGGGGSAVYVRGAIVTEPGDGGSLAAARRAVFRAAVLLGVSL